ncbi:MAG: hypothetical protein RSA97_02865 [Oscillospiraceae bacterium]
MKKQEFFSMRINGLSVIMMLILLCLTVFGVLSLVSANAELRLSNKNASHIAAYSQCDAQAQHALSDICNSVASAENYDEIAAILNGYGKYCATVLEDGISVDFETEKFDSLSIDVKLNIDSNRKVTVEKYMLNISEAEAQEEMSLWQG